MGFKEFQSLLPYYKSGHNDTTKLDHSVGREKGLFREIQTAKAISGGWAEGIAKKCGENLPVSKRQIVVGRSRQVGTAWELQRWEVGVRAREACGVRSAVDKSELIKKYMPPSGQSWPEGPIRVVRTFLRKQKTASRGLCGMRATLLFT